MANAPDRIWVHYAPHISEDEMGATIVGWEEKQAAPAFNYVSADLYKELQHELENTRFELENTQLFLKSIERKINVFLEGQ